MSNGEPEAIICRKCNEEGHKAAECTTIVCEICGVKNDHVTRNCNKSKVCSRCGHLGHLRKDCKETTPNAMYCHFCSSTSHRSSTCAKIWRSYIRKRDRSEHYPERVYCYNCGGEGHYGDDCLEQRRVELKYVEDSAFNGESLPEKCKERYFREISRLRREKERSRRRVVEKTMTRQEKRASIRKFDSRRGNRDDYNYNNNSKNRHF